MFVGPRTNHIARWALVIALILGGSTAPSSAWGPSTHVALSEALLERVAADPDHALRFLLTAPLREAFLRASMSPDLTASAFSGRKVDPAYNKLFHDRGIGADMVARAHVATDHAGLAFALGWLGHAVSDRVMSRGGGIIYKDMFGLTKATKRRLGRSLTGISKFCIDALLIRDLAVPSLSPLVDEPLLVDAIKASPAGAKLSDPAGSIASFRSSFSWTCSTVYSLAQSVGANTKAFPACIHELADVDEDSVEVPGFETSVDAMEAALTKAMPGPIALDEPVEGATPSPPAPTFVTRVTDKAGRLARRTGQYMWDGSSITRKLRQVAVEQSLRVMNTLGGDGSVDGRILVTFAGDMINGVLTWPQIQTRIRALAQPPGASTGR